jgi:oligopeptide transport system substrate-binding protein
MNDYSSSLGNNWNPHTWETNADDTINSYLSMPFVTMQAENTEDGIYQWIYEMATEINDVTATHKEDLEKYPVKLPEGKTAADIESGYVFEIKLNPKACWQDGTPINADSYIYSMKQLLDPAMKNYRANLYYSGESAIAGGNGYYNSDLAGQPIYGDAAGLEGVEEYFLDLTLPSVFFGGNSAKDYYDAGYADYYKDAEGNDLFTKLTETAGYVPVTDEIIADLTTIAVNFGDSNPEAWKEFCFAVTGTYEALPFEKVGLYKTDDYTIYYVMENPIDYYYGLTSFTSTWLVYEPLYEAGKDTTGSLVTTDYGTSVETSMSYGPYKLESLQEDKQIVFTQNENWYGWEKQPNGALLSYTPYLVDGEHVQRYQTTKIVINVMDDDAAKQAFLKGELVSWAPNSEELTTYGASDRLYKADESYTMSFFFNTGLEALQEMDNSKGNVNSVVMSNVNFRKAFSLAIDRAEWVTATAGFKPSFGLMNDQYYYDFYNNPESSYRSSDEAMQAVCDLYEVKYGEGTPYATLKDAYKSINGYNLTEAKELMAQACKELVEAGLYKEGEEIKIRVGYKKGALDSADNKQMELMNKYINAAAEGSGFGHITLEALGNINDRYGDTAKGEYAIGYGAWGGAALYPFRNFQVYCDTEQYSIHEAGCWDPSTETFTINVNGEDVTMTWQEWSRSMIGAGRFAGESNDVKLQITAAMEKAYLEFYYRIPLATGPSHGRIKLRTTMPSASSRT